MTLQRKLDALTENIETLDTFAIDTLSRFATWLAPLVPAAMVYHASQAYIPDVGPVQALIAAASIELLGLQVTSNWLTAGEYNRRSDERLPMRGYVTMLAAYVATILAIVVGLKVAPQTVSWLAIVMLSMLTLLAATAFVQRRQLSALMRHLGDIEDVQHRQQLRQLKRQSKTPAKTPAETPKDTSTREKAPSEADILRQLETLVRQSPDIGLRPLGEAAGVSKDKAKRILVEAGWHKNGNGWEVVNHAG